MLPLTHIIAYLYVQPSIVFVRKLKKVAQNCYNQFQGNFYEFETERKAEIHMAGYKDQLVQEKQIHLQPIPKHKGATSRQKIRQRNENE